MSLPVKTRHLFGAGAAACSVCCAAPLLALIGIAGAAATVATFLVAGAVFAVVVAVGALLASLARRYLTRGAACPPATQGPVDLELTVRSPGTTP